MEKNISSTEGQSVPNSEYLDIIMAVKLAPEEWLIFCSKGREHVYESGFVLTHIPSRMDVILEDPKGAREVLDAMLAMGVPVVRRMPSDSPKWKFWRWFW